MFKVKSLHSPGLVPVSQKSQDVSGLFLVLHFPLYLCSTKVLSHQTQQSSWFFNIKNMFKDQLFKTSRMQFHNWLSGAEMFMGLSRNRPQVSNAVVLIGSG